MSIREIFFNSIDEAVINECDKGALMQISTVLCTFTMFLLRGTSEIGLFRHLCDYIFGVGNFGNTKSMRVILFFSKYLKFNLDFKITAKN